MPTKTKKIKKIVITNEAAHEIEDHIRDMNQEDGFGYPMKDFKDLMRALKMDKRVTGSVLSWCHTINLEARELHNNVSRDAAESIVESCKGLERYLDKCFTVQKAFRSSTLKTYPWLVEF